MNVKKMSIIALGSLFAVSCSQLEKHTQKPNILFIGVDDLRPQASIYGQDGMVTPNLERLAKSGVSFTNSYCNIPVCGASRASLLSGVRPTRTRFVNYYCRKDSDLPDYASLPKWFKEQGYRTVSNGKIFHHRNDDLEAWSETPWEPIGKGIGLRCYLTEDSRKIIEKNKLSSYPGLIKGPAYEAADVADTEYPDGLLAKKAIHDLERLKNAGEPFFLGVGFRKPHLPFNAPKKYWDLYKAEDIQLPENSFKPHNAPDAAMNEWLELRDMYDDIPTQGTLSDEKARKLIHGYYACVSYVDAQIGKILDKLEELELDKNTIIVLWGDHGWHLGEHSLWCKHSNFHKTLRTPLIVCAPGFSKGEYTEAMTELIDLYPTLCELSDIPVPDHLDGTSFAPVLKDPTSSVKDAVYCRYIEGESVVNQRYTYTEWRDLKGEKYASMLYDRKNDPDENNNIVDQQAYREIVDSLSKRMVQFNGEIKLKSNNMFSTTDKLTIQNSSFEDSIQKGWKTYCNKDANITYEQLKENNCFGNRVFSARVLKTGDKYDDAGLILDQPMSLSQGDVLCINFFSRVTVENIPMKVRIRSDKGEVLSKNVFITDKWSPYSVKFKVPKNGNWNIEFFFLIEGAKYYLDNVVVTKPKI